MKQDIIAIGIVSMILLLYTLFAALDMFIGAVLLTAGLSPIAVIWMVWVVIKYGEYKGPELNSDQEYGYLDR
jgi:hypothetical protein